MSADTLPGVKVGDRVRHADGGDATGVLRRFWAFPLAVVEWESTGRTSTENAYLLIKADG